MEVRSTSATLLLERPTGALERTVRTTECDVATEVSTVAFVGVEPAPADGIGILLQSPGLAVLALVFLIEGYRWLGVLHIGTTPTGSLAFGSVGLAATALLAPLAALVLTSGRRTRGLVLIEELVIASAFLVTVTTDTALIVGGSAWKTVAGTSSLLLAATALGAVVLSERARRRVASANAD